MALLYQVPLPGSLLLALWFVVRIVLPAVVGSGALGAAAIVLKDSDAEPGSSPSPWEALRPLAREVLAAGLFAGMISLAFIVFLRGLGLLLLPLAYGPPILIQVIAVERAPLQLAWPRTRTLLRHNWGRVLITLLVVVLLVSLLAAVAIALVFGATRGLGEAAQTVVLSSVQAVLVAITLPYLAAVQFVIYSHRASRVDPP